MAKLFVFFVIAVVATVVAISACQPQSLTGTKPSPPLLVTLEVSPVADAEGTAFAELSVTTLLDEEKLDIGFSLPEGLELVSGELNSTHFDIPANGTVTRQIVVKASQAGMYKIAAGAGSSWRESYTYRKYANACLEADKGKVKAAACHPSEQSSDTRTLAVRVIPSTECTADADCGVGGCSGQVCATAKEAAGLITTCEYREEYGCLKLTGCGCVDGKCGWRQTAEYESCLDDIKSQQPPQQEQPQ